MICSLVLLAFIVAFFAWNFLYHGLDEGSDKSRLLPQLEILSIQITSLSVEETEMMLNLLVKNQLPFGMTADSLEYLVTLNDMEIIRNKYSKSFELDRFDSTWISLPFTLQNQNLKKIMKRNKQSNSDSVEFRLRASLYSDIVFMKKFDIDIKKVSSMFYIPEMEVEHLKIDSLNFQRAALNLLLDIRNQNPFTIEMKDIRYRFAVENNKWIEGAIPGLSVIKANDHTSLEIPFQLSLKEAGNALLELLKKARM